MHLHADHHLPGPGLAFDEIVFFVLSVHRGRYSLPSVCFCSFSSSYWMNQPIICRHSASASSGGKPCLRRPRAHLVDHLLDAPRHARFRRRLLELPGTIDIGEALADQIDQGLIDAVDLGPHLFHVAAILGFARRHDAIL